MTAPLGDASPLRGLCPSPLPAPLPPMPISLMSAGLALSRSLLVPPPAQANNKLCCEWLVKLPSRESGTDRDPLKEPERESGTGGLICQEDDSEEWGKGDSESATPANCSAKDEEVLDELGKETAAAPMSQAPACLSEFWQLAAAAAAAAAWTDDRLTDRSRKSRTGKGEGGCGRR